MIYGYIRVSSDKQTVENQRFEIKKFCEKQNIVINDWIEETISGVKNYTKRQLGGLLKKIHKDDIIICSELSRLGRNLFMIMEILNIGRDRKKPDKSANKRSVSKKESGRHRPWTTQRP